MGKFSKLIYDWKIISIPFTQRSVVISRWEWFGPTRFLGKYEYVWTIQPNIRVLEYRMRGRNCKAIL
jgi:hypothetical protein